MGKKGHFILSGAVDERRQRCDLLGSAWDKNCFPSHSVSSKRKGGDSTWQKIKGSPKCWSMSRGKGVTRICQQVISTSMDQRGRRMMPFSTPSLVGLNFGKPWQLLWEFLFQQCTSSSTSESKVYSLHGRVFQAVHQPTPLCMAWKHSWLWHFL